VANQTGTATITVTGGDGTATASDTFVVTVNPLLTLFPDWIAEYRFSEPNALASADPDGDGWSNAQEYAFGLVPNVAGGTLVKIENSGTGAKITYLQRSGVTYAVKSATDLAAGFTAVTSTKSSPQPAGLPLGYEQYEATLSTGTKGFLKVEAVVP